MLDPTVNETNNISIEIHCFLVVFLVVGLLHNLSLLFIHLSCMTTLLTSSGRSRNGEIGFLTIARCRSRLRANFYGRAGMYVCQSWS